ncbi:hypothetical protein ACJMK2_002673, partial [Sinanodonta woodiana]
SCETDIEPDELIINQDDPFEDECSIKSDFSDSGETDIEPDELIKNQDDPFEDECSIESNDTNPCKTDIKSNKLIINQDDPIEDKCSIESNDTNPCEMDIKSDKLIINQDNPDNDNENDILTRIFGKNYQPKPVVKKIKDKYKSYFSFYSFPENDYDLKDFKNRSYEEDPDSNFYRPVDYHQLCEYYDRNLGNPIFTRKKETAVGLLTEEGCSIRKEYPELYNDIDNITHKYYRCDKLYDTRFESLDYR